MHKALHRRDDVDRLYVSIKKKEEDLPAIMIASMHRFEDYIKNRVGRLITATRNNITQASTEQPPTPRKPKMRT